MENFICLHCHWELTYRCNLRCRHCYVSPGDGSSEVSVSKAKSIIDELKDLGCLYLSFSGGEIFLREDFFEIASYARKQGFALRLMTNGTLIDEARAQRICGLYPLAVDISLYAADRRLHDRITSTDGSFDKAVKAVQLLKAKGIKVYLKFLVMNDNIQEFAAVKSLAQDLGADFQFDLCLVRKDNGSGGPLKYRLNQAQIKEFFLNNNISAGKRELSNEALLCNVGLNSIFISAGLDVYPCIALKLKLGSLYCQRLSDIWQGSKELDCIRRLKFSDLAECHSCNVVSFCERCFGIALSDNGDMLGASEFDCSFARALSEIAIETVAKGLLSPVSSREEALASTRDLT
jgi:radical SAM protein with 4Fe4S-binding SPASM domain